jgi:hypothetical protein
MTLVSSRFTAFAVLTAICAFAAALWAQEDSTGVSQPELPPVSPTVDSSRAQVFVEIQLTNEGVVAYDSSGDRWTYDFETLRFVPSKAVSGETGYRERGDEREEVEPVEVRCTEEKIVDYPALTAVYVGRDEYVRGDIKSYSRVTVKGWVKGSVQSFNKAVLVTSTGQVDGDVKAPEVEIKEGGIVKGQVIETPPYEIPVDAIRTGLSTAGIWVVFGFTLGFSLVIFLISALAPTRVANVTACVVDFPVKTSLVGLLFVFLMPVIVVLVVLTVIGVLIVWAIPLAYFVSFALGMTATSVQVLSKVMGRQGKAAPGLPTASIIGIVYYMGLWALVALTFDPNSGDALGVLLLLLAIFSSLYPIFAGTGAVVMTRFGSRSYAPRLRVPRPSGEPAPAPAPPPIPQTPADLGRPSTGSVPGPLPSDSGDTV